MQHEGCYLGYAERPTLREYPWCTGLSDATIHAHAACSTRNRLPYCTSGFRYPSFRQRATTGGKFLQLSSHRALRPTYLKRLTLSPLPHPPPDLRQLHLDDAGSSRVCCIEELARPHHGRGSSGEGYRRGHGGATIGNGRPKSQARAVSQGQQRYR